MSATPGPTLQTAAPHPTAEAWLAALVEQSPDAILSRTLDGFITSWNPGAERMFGWTAAEMLGRHVTALMPVDCRHLWSGTRAALERGESLEFPDAVWLARDRRLVPVWISLSPIRDGRGAVVGVSTIARDISAYKGVEAALRESEARLRLVADSVQGLIARIDRDRRYRFVNAVGLSWYGLAADQVIGRTIPEVIGEERWAAVEEQFRRVLDRGETVSFENRISRPGAQPRDMLVTAVPERDPEGMVCGCYSLAVDITERKRAETALRDSELTLRLAVDAAELGLWDYDVRTGALHWSARLKELYGLPPQAEVDFDRFVGLLHPDDRASVLAGYQAALDPRGDGRFGFEHRICAADGAVRWLQAAGQVVFDAAGAPVRALGSSRDVTARRQSEERQRLLMAELDHRVKNALATVQSIALRTLGPGPSGEALMGRIAALAHAHAILSAEEWRGAELRGLVEAVVSAHSTAPGRVSLKGPDVVLPPKLAQSVALALHELVTNAAKYGALSTRGGRLSLEWDRLDEPARLRLLWRESGGPPVAPPVRRGFGSTLIERSLAYEFEARVEMRFEREGVVCDMELPLA
jgi:PAS domain S-box-containing protein